MTFEGLLPADAVRPRWSTASSLVYIGCFVVLAATGVLVGILGGEHGSWARVGYAALATAAAAASALWLERLQRPVAAGVSATVAVALLALTVGAFEQAIGILDVDVGDYQPATLLVEAVTVAAAVLALRRLRAPLLVLPVALTLWLAVVDLGSLGSWRDAGAGLSILVGAALVGAGVALDRAERRPYALWLHLVGGIAVGGGVLALVEGDVPWALVGVLSLVYVAVAYGLERSSYAVLGAIGILLTTTYFTFKGFAVLAALLPFGAGEVDAGLDAWQVALCFVGAGVAIVVLGLLDRRLTLLRRP